MVTGRFVDWFAFERIMQDEKNCLKSVICVIILCLRDTQTNWQHCTKRASDESEFGPARRSSATMQGETLSPCYDAGNVDGFANRFYDKILTR